MNTTMFSYNQEMATQIGGGLQYVSGGYDLKITRAQFLDNKFIEFDFEEKEGRKFNYVSINYQKNDGNPNEFGWKMINAIMGCVGVKTLTADQQGYCPELHGMYLKAVLQRINYVKTSGDKAGEQGFKFEFKLPANISTGKTVKETLENKPAESFEKYAASIEDKDESHRGNFSQPQQSGQPVVGGNNIPKDFDDDIPF